MIKIVCPACGAEVGDKKFVACSICGYCTHPIVVGHVCQVCKQTDDYGELEEAEEN